MSSDVLSNDHVVQENVNSFPVRNQIQSLILNKTWQQLILSAPPALNHVALLMILMSTNDYNVVIPINYRVQFVSHTNSLRTKLTEFSSRFASTIRSTENELDEILDKFDHIIDSIKASIEIIKLVSIDRAKIYLSQSLQHIEKSIEETSTLFDSIKQNFAIISEFLTELFELVKGINIPIIHPIYNGEITTSVQDIRTHWQSISEFFQILINEWNESKQKVQSSFNQQITEILNNSNRFITNNDRQQLLTNLIQSAIETRQSIAELIFVTEIYLKISRNQLTNRVDQLQPLIRLSSLLSRINAEHQYWTNMITSAIEMVRLIEQQEKQFNNTLSVIEIF